MKFKEIKLLDVGHTSLMAGAIFTDGEKALLCFFPKEDANLPPEPLEMDQDESKAKPKKTVAKKPMAKNHPYLRFFILLVKTT